MRKNGKVVLPHCVAPFVSIWKFKTNKQKRKFAL